MSAGNFPDLQLFMLETEMLSMRVYEVSIGNAVGSWIC